MIRYAAASMAFAVPFFSFPISEGAPRRRERQRCNRITATALRERLVAQFLSVLALSFGCAVRS